MSLEVISELFFSFFWGGIGVMIALSSLLSFMVMLKSVLFILTSGLNNKDFESGDPN